MLFKLSLVFLYFFMGKELKKRKRYPLVLGVFFLHDFFFLGGGGGGAGAGGWRDEAGLLSLRLVSGYFTECPQVLFEWTFMELLCPLLRTKCPFTALGALQKKLVKSYLVRYPGDPSKMKRSQLEVLRWIWQNGFNDFIPCILCGHVYISVGDSAQPVIRFSTVVIVSLKSTRGFAWGPRWALRKEPRSTDLTQVWPGADKGFHESIRTLLSDSKSPCTGMALNTMHSAHIITNTTQTKM